MKNEKLQRIWIIAAACATVCCLWGCQENESQKQNVTVSETSSMASEADNTTQESNKESTADCVPAQSEDMTIDNLMPGTVLDSSEISEPSAYFKSYEITKGDAVWQEINGKSWHENDNIALSDLRYLKMLHYNFNHQIQVGEMIVNAAISEDTLQVFRDLFDQQYEIEKMFLADHYWTKDADDTDENSIEHNNTSAFNYREITGGGKLSNHALGRAIDVNPQQNPYIYLGSDGNYRWDHENASAYIDRTTGDPHVIVSGDICQATFEKYGFSWGGYWHNPIDYQHFEKR